MGRTANRRAANSANPLPPLTPEQEYTQAWLSAQGEGGRAALCMRGYGNAATAYYFAREAARYARIILD